MTPFYHCQITENPLGEGDDQHQSRIPLFNLGTSSNSTAPWPPILFHNQRDSDDHLLQKETQLQEEIFGKKLATIKRSTWSDYVVNPSSSYQIVREGDHKHGSIKWMSSKMRIMKKMLNSDETTIISKSRRISHQRQNQKQSNQEIIKVNIPGGTVRVCSDCNTTKTPLWRSGPHGPKSLCNACGIRQRKARRAMAASEASTVVLPLTTCYAKRDEASDVVHRTVPFKKRCRFTGYEATDQRKLNCYEDIVISLKKSTAFHRVFPQDEKDAAILLMALSCGLLCS